jgi:hypothetical protein
MALQFRPYFDDSAEQRTNEWSRQLGQDIAGIGENFAQGRQQQMAMQRQAMLDKYLVEKEIREKEAHAYKHGTPIDPNISVAQPNIGVGGQSSFMPGGRAPIGTGTPLIDQFNQWMAGGMKAASARPEFMPALGEDERKRFFEAQNPKPQPNYVIPNLDGSGNVSGFTPLPPGSKPAGGMARPPAPSEGGFGQENKLRTEFLSQSKDFNDTAASYQRMIDSSTNPSPAGDLSLIFNYMKMLDPGSTVREGEFANAAASGSYGARFQAAAQKIVTGQRLDDSMRSDFMGRARELYQGQMARHKQRETEYQKLGSSYGADPSRITPNLATPISGYDRATPSNGGDDEAVAWARANPQDPRSAEILRINGQR